MTRHTALYDIVTALDMTAEGITTPAQVYRSATADSPDHEVFIILKWGDVDAVFGTAAAETLEVWAYHRTSYVPVENILKKIRDAVLASPGTMGDVEWNGYSRDLWDDIYQCVTRYAAFTLPAGGS